MVGLKTQGSQKKKSPVDFKGLVFSSAMFVFMQPKLFCKFPAWPNFQASITMQTGKHSNVIGSSEVEPNSH